MALPLRYSVRNLAIRKWTSFFTAGGIGLVVAVTVLLAGLVEGLQHMLVTTGERENLIVLRRGSTSEGSSFLPREVAAVLRTLPGVATVEDGTPLSSAELVNQAFMQTVDGGRENALVRGIEPMAFRVHRAVKLVAGRPMSPGNGEVIVGSAAANRYAGIALGRRIELGRREWSVVGIFDSGGTAFDSEIWADLRDVQDDTRRQGLSAIRLTVGPEADLQALVRRIESEPRWPLHAMPELEYYREQAEAANTLYAIVLALAAAMSTGAVFGAANTMYATVSARTREIGTLRALGFRRTAILLAFLSESMLLGMCGFVAGVLLGVLGILSVNALLSGVALSMTTYSVASVLLRPSVQGVALGLAFAVAIGVVGGLAPAWRASRLPVNQALRRA